MRLYTSVYSTSDEHLGDVYTLKEASFTEALDEVGSIACSIPLADKEGFDLLASEREIRLHLEHDDTTREWGRGIVRKRNIKNLTDLRVTGPDATDKLKRANTLLGRSYENQTLQTIANSLIALAPGWTVTVAPAYANLLHSARFEGVSVLKALTRLAEERGLHIRQGTAAQTIEIGAFGTDNGIWAVAPDSIGLDIYLNDNLILIDDITQDTSTQEVVNWIIPIGAGEGTAALTLKYSTRSIAGGYPYNIQSMTGPDGRTLYYLSDSASIALYGQSQKVVTFKEIGPIANSSPARELAANALYDAAAAWLQRNSVALVTYKISAKKTRQTIRAGDKIRVTYKGYIETEKGDVVPIDLNNQLFWVMRKRENVGSDSTTLGLDIASVDRYEMDTARVVVGAIESIRVKNVAVQTFPAMFTYSQWDTIQWGTNVYHQKAAIFPLRVDSKITDLIQVSMQFRTRPLSTTATFDHYDGTADHNEFLETYAFAVRVSEHYPQSISLYIDGENVTSEFGGPWAGSDAAVDITLELTDKIINDPGGLYQTHRIEFRCEPVEGQDFVHVQGSAPPYSVVNISHGFVDCTISVFGTVQAIAPTT